MSTTAQAIDRLAYHAGNLEEERAVPSFVGMLRPYKGLRQEAFEDVMACLRDLAPMLRAEKAFPRSLVASLWALIWYPRYWGLDPDGMLRRNGLISDPDQVKLEAWVNQLAYSVSQLLDRASDSEAFEKP